MNKDSNRISKEPLKSLIHKVGTFRGKKNQRSSTTDLKYADSTIQDESIMRMPTDENSVADITTTDLDSTTKSYYHNSSNYTHRSELMSILLLFFFEIQ